MTGEARNGQVPLSEDEERILSEIEDLLTETDPDLVREVTETTLYTQPLRSMKLAGALFAERLNLLGDGNRTCQLDLRYALTDN